MWSYHIRYSTLLLRVACLAEEIFTDYKRGRVGKKFRTSLVFCYASSFGRVPKRVFISERLNTKSPAENKMARFLFSQQFVLPASDNE
jgi:hypothetical protein